MIEVTATMFPSTVRNERSLFDQIAWSARRVFHLHLGPVAERADRAERPDHDRVAVLQPGEDLEVFFTSDAGLDHLEDGLAVADEEHTLDLFALLTRLQLGRLDPTARTR